MFGKAKIPSALWVIISVLIIISFLFSADFILCSLIFLYIPFTYRLFFIKGNCNILFWGLMHQWLSVSIQLIYSILVGISLNDLFRNTIFPADLMEYTNYLSVIGLYFYNLGIYTVISKIKISYENDTWDRIDPFKVFQVYIVVSLIINASQLTIWAFPTIVQYLFFLFYIKWGFFLVSFIAIFKKAPHLKPFLFAFLGFEFLLGLSSYFAASFMNFIIFTFIAFSSIRSKITYVQSFILLLISALVFHIAVLWTASKKDYRLFITQGQKEYTVTISNEEARKKLMELIVNLDAATYNTAILDLVNRVGYVQYFAAAVRFVPEKLPHENGKVYFGAISHYLVPRFLNPSKEVIDDSKHTNKYTGLGLSDSRMGTSFSLGSFADAYVDFGPYLMYLPIFLFGCLVGFFYKILSKDNFWGLVFTGPFFLLINIYQINTIKALGFLLIYFIVIYFIRPYLVRLIAPIITKYSKA